MPSIQHSKHTFRVLFSIKHSNSMFTNQRLKKTWPDTKYRKTTKITRLESRLPLILTYCIIQSFQNSSGPQPIVLIWVCFPFNSLNGSLGSKNVRQVFLGRPLESLWRALPRCNQQSSWVRIVCWFSKAFRRTGRGR